MHFAELIHALRETGGTLTRRGDRLFYSGPAALLTPTVRDAIAMHRRALLDLLEEGKPWRVAMPAGPSPHPILLLPTRSRTKASPGRNSAVERRDDTEGKK